MSRKRVGVLISGRGSNLQALIDACKPRDFPAEIVLVISNVPQAQGLLRAEAALIPTITINHKDFSSREAFDVALDKALNEAHVELLCNAGFMRLHTAGFVERWRDRHLNIHPSLLPAFRGLDTHVRNHRGGCHHQRLHRAFRPLGDGFWADRGASRRSGSRQRHGRQPRHPRARGRASPLSACAEARLLQAPSEWRASA